METKADVQAVVWEYLRRKDISASELGRRAGIPVATLNRMLRDDPTYRGQPDHWRQLARFEDLHLNETEVLAAVGLGPRPNDQNDGAVDPWAVLETAMRLFKLPEEAKAHVRGQFQWLLDAAEFRRRGLSSDPQ